jgi:SAM-dependent methyltransferase
MSDPEGPVRACYSTWSGRYYDEFYSADAPYPPVHRDILRWLLREAGAKSVLDAGCGPASFLRHVVDDGIEPYGFDLTPEMVAEARRVLSARGVLADRIWQGSVLDPAAFQGGGCGGPRRFDAAVCVGVLPHVPPTADGSVICNLRDAVKDEGLVVVEARNQLFALFTLNRYSYRFFVDDMIRAGELTARAGADTAGLRGALESLAKHFRTELPPIRRGKADEPGYDEVLSRTHNPLVLRQQFEAAGFTNVRLLFYHYHCLPPMFEAEVPELFRSASLAMEDPEDWRGYFMASAFLLVGRRA